MGLWNRISRQLSSPQGLGGRIIAMGMNRGNEGITANAIEQLGLVPNQRVLEVAFGGGASVRVLLDRDVKVTGIDQSADMVAAANKGFREEISSGRLDVVEGDVNRMPFADNSFDRAMAVNVIYFLSDLGPALTELSRVLAPGGRLVIAIRDSAVMQKVDPEVFTIRSADEVRSALERAGFTDVGVMSPAEKKLHLITGTAPPDYGY